MIGGVLASVVFGLFTGIFSGLLGIGGGVIMVPSFRLLFGLSAFSSTATSLFTVIPTSISGTVSHLRNRTCIPKLGLALGIGGACLSPVGVLLANRSPAWLVMLAAAAVLAYSATTMFRKALKAPKRAERLAKAASKTQDAPATSAAAATAATESPAPAEPPAAAIPHIPGKTLALGLAIGMAVGVISGYVGVGGGFVFIPLMLSVFKLSMKQASGTSLVAVMILAIPGAISQGFLGNIDYTIGLATACGTIPGAFLGGQLTRRVPERTLRFIFAFFLLFAAALMALKEFGLFL